MLDDIRHCRPRGFAIRPARFFMHGCRYAMLLPFIATLAPCHGPMLRYFMMPFAADALRLFDAMPLPLLAA